MNISISAPSLRPEISTAEINETHHVVTPGEIITTGTGFMRGHGTYLKNDSLIASTTGVVDKVNKLICVRPVNSRYNGEVGDVVVGRVTQVTQRRWKVDTNARLDSMLMLSAVNLPGNVFRRRVAEDELLMREFFIENDVIAAEVQSIYGDGALALHRVKFGSSLKFGTFYKAKPAFIKRTKTQSHVLPCGVLVILGNNGYCWVGPPQEEKVLTQQAEEKPVDVNTVTDEMRMNIARVRNCIAALDAQNVAIYDTSVANMFDASVKYKTQELLVPAIQEELTQEIKAFMV
eukprot:CFRG3787T1